MAVAEKQVVKLKDRERKTDKWLGEISETEKEYIRILDKHRKRALRVKRNGKEHLMDNLKAKKAMQEFRKNLPAKYYPRGKRNIKELADWKLFFEKNKEWLQTSKPEMYMKIKDNLEMEKNENEKIKKDALDWMRNDKEVNDEQNSEDEEPYWMDCETEDNKRDGVLQCGGLRPEELEEEEQAIKKHLKFIKKKKYTKPMDQLPDKELSPYELIRENIIQERVEAMEKSGLFPDIDQLKARIFRQKMII